MRNNLDNETMTFSPLRREVAKVKDPSPGGGKEKHLEKEVEIRRGNGNEWK